MLVTLLGVMLLIPIGLNAWVIQAGSHGIVNRPSRLPAWHVALVLGTSPYLRGGHRNAFFTERIFTAAELYNSGQVQQVLVSGANPSPYYNEPRRMYQALVAWGVPGNAITLDFAGFRTLDSVIRAHRIFGLRRAIVITQKFHAYRAVFLANRVGLQAVAFVPPRARRGQSFWVAAREYLARVKAVLDVYVLHTAPRYLGPVRPIGVPPKSSASRRIIQDGG